MASPFDSILSFKGSVIGESSTIAQTQDKSDKKWRSSVWEYCRRPIVEERQDYLYCAQCPSDLTKLPYNENNLANMKKHLFKHHEIVINKLLSKNQIKV
jgi:hypothetical protein